MIRTKLIGLMTVFFIIVLPALSFASEVNLPKTGQVTCSDEDGNVIDCANTGQDGDIQAGVEWPSPRFENNADGTVTDHLTGLIWLKNANCGGPMNWKDGLTYCNNLASGSCDLTDGSVAGDWRLPNFIELESLVNVEESNMAIWLNTQGFTYVQSSIYWSASTYALSSTDLMWYVGMGGGGMYYDYKLDNHYVWPVRGGQSGPAQTWKTGQTTSYAPGDDGDLQRGVSWPSPRFEDNADGTVTDHLTGLIWLKNANYVKLMWKDALAFCNDLASGSWDLTDGSVAGDWRLPNRKELLSLVDFSRHNSALPQGHLLGNVQIYLWSASTYANDTYSAWCLGVLYGEVFAPLKSNHLGVKAVRGGQVGSFGNLTISNPNGGESLFKGQDYTITWDSSNISGNIQIDLYKGGTESENMLMQLAAVTENDGEYTFNPPDSLTDGNDYLIGISAGNGTVWDFSNSFFTINSKPQAKAMPWIPLLLLDD